MMFVFLSGVYKPGLCQRLWLFYGVQKNHIGYQFRAISLFTEAFYSHTLRRDYFVWKYSKSTGPGGQNVNKSNTKVELRFKPEAATWLSDRVRSKLLENVGPKLNKEGELVLTSDRFKSQKRNIEDAMDKVNALIETASYVPPEPSIEQRKTVARLVRIQNEKRLVAKKQKAQLKRERTKFDFD